MADHHTNVVTLDRELYSYSDVDRMLDLGAGTSKRWIDGYRRQSKTYEPIVRPRPTGSELVTWGEFVETSMLARYREAGLRMIKLRPIVQGLRERLGIAYPLAHLKPLVDEPTLSLVYELEEAAELDGDLRLVYRLSDGQVMLSSQLREFKSSADYGDADAGDRVVVRLYPLGPHRSVTFDPDRKFGQAVVRSVPTAVLYEQYRAGDPIEFIAETYELERDKVLDAIEFERQRDLSAA
ncbi:MAG TPA: DUF433 domain-containing protein [Micromonosporaceae bacterium]|jgi:uncharacterized protein (DUF433 family)/transposase|nr:DUF433 domain-containing protein [Micromonosporaceae bacterium]